MAMLKIIYTVVELSNTSHCVTSSVFDFSLFFEFEFQILCTVENLAAIDYSSYTINVEKRKKMKEREKWECNCQQLPKITFLV